ncbi:hypothetical protein SISNIDRAFT_441742 [Sistotremastrum niveocremeum HHB9708]|uniref:Pescadillo homolog n=1 Tax=Sistotremastrum niveocremeum HHB9708 TaxID=1314777 RepID=A0A164UCU3_9AGAM|nr:hypothetical protein SISNIDRAFT_441742 [Sistotremastrum niveocremeum HHB9708]
MAKIKRRGESGAAKAYVTRSAAIKKLQCSLADFRRLCILKGIFPREPRSRKKANKGSSAPTSFYYAKDIAYLAHEPVLKKLREHKAFAKKLARALGRGEWSSAKSLDEQKPVYRLDHIIKERYPTFTDAVRDIDDALCMIFLFATLPSNPRIPPTLISNCARLAAEWQLYVMRSQSLRKVFLSIKGVYYQAEVMDQTVTWLVPYMFTQTIPTDVDVRVMLTFLELYQTLLGFVFFKLYTDIGLVYPPPLDIKKDEEAAGVGAFNLNEIPQPDALQSNPGPNVDANGKKISSKDVRQTIKSINADASAPSAGTKSTALEAEAPSTEETFVPQPSKNATGLETVDLPTLQSIASLPQTTNTSLFSPFVFFLSRETPRPLFEFIVRSFGGRIGWPASSGAGSPISEDDESITHVIIDRPVVPKAGETETQALLRLKRKYVQPQWVVDCINAQKILPEELYGQGKTLPPHLSPFGEQRGAYEPLLNGEGGDGNAAEAEGSEVDEDEEMAEDEETAPILKEATVADPALLRAAEIAAEAAGVDAETFSKETKKAQKRSRTSEKTVGLEGEENMNKMMMSNKKRQLYERMKHGERKRAAEVSLSHQR